jgi:hypothetical protein
MEIIVPLNIQNLFQRLFKLNERWSPNLLVAGLQRITGITSSCEYSGSNYRKNNITNLMIIIHLDDRVGIYKLVKSVSWDHAIYCDTDKGLFAETANNRFNALSSLEKGEFYAWQDAELSSIPSDTKESINFRTFLRAQGSQKKMIFRTPTGFAVRQIVTGPIIAEEAVVDQPRPDNGNLNYVADFYQFRRFKSESPLRKSQTYDKTTLDTKIKKDPTLEEFRNEETREEAISNLRDSSDFKMKSGKRKREEIKEIATAKNASILAKRDNKTESNITEAVIAQQKLMNEAKRLKETSLPLTKRFKSSGAPMTDFSKSPSVKILPGTLYKDKRGILMIAGQEDKDFVTVF